MPERRQKVRHTQTQADIYVGLIGQITVDTTNNEVRVHDGSTAGGIRQARQDLANVAAATSGNDGKMTSTQVQNLAQVIADLAALAATGVSFDDTGLQVTAAHVQAALEAYDALIATNKGLADAHAALTNNPHAVTKTQVGLANVTNDAQLKIASDLADLASVANALANLGIVAQADAAYTAGTSTDEDLVSPAKIRAAINSYLNWPAGQVIMRAKVQTKAGLLLCDGASYLQSAYPTLFAEIGTAFGGDATNFNVPDAADAFIMALGTGSIGDTGGATGHVMTLANLILHGHPYQQKTSTENQTFSNNSGAIVTSSNTNTTRSAYTGTPSAAAGQSIGGEGQATPDAIPTLPPYLKLPMYITTGGD